MILEGSKTKVVVLLTPFPLCNCSPRIFSTEKGCLLCATPKEQK